MGTERFGLRAILSVTLAAGPLLSVFPLPASASGPATIFHVAISLGGYRAAQATETGQPAEVMLLWPAGLLPPGHTALASHGSWSAR